MKIRTSIAFASISLLAFSSVQAAQMKQAFSYDAAGRLISVTTDGDTAQASLHERYVYDKSGNIIEKEVNGETIHMTYDAGNQLMSRTDADGTVDFGYDSAGRLVSEHTNGQVLAQYEYGYLDKVIQVTRGDQVTQFHYNARGMLVAKERDGQIIETFGWDGIGLLAKNETVYANEAHISGGVPLAAIDAGSENAEMQYFDSDYLGTTTAVYSASGEVNTHLASSFGAGTESGELRFTGKAYDADLDAHVFPFRNYRAEAGNWASADPAGFPDGPNQHYYAAVPTMGLDPLGLTATQWGTLSFLEHFYNGGGDPVSLSSMEFLSAVKTEAGAQEITKRFEDQILAAGKGKAPSTGTFTETFNNSYDFGDVHYVFGSGTLSGSYVGNLSLQGSYDDYDEYSYSGSAFDSFDDTFSDPFDLIELLYDTSNPTVNDGAPQWLVDVFNLGGTPFDIFGDWNENVNGTFEM